MKALRKGEYYGAEEKRMDYGGLLISEYAYRDSAVDWHYHENPYFMYVTGGHLLDINKRKTTKCVAGTLLLHNWQDAHCNEKHSQDSRGFHIEFDREWLEKHNFDAVLLEGSNEIRDPRIHQLIWQILSEFRFDDHFTEATLQSLVLNLCSSLESKQERLNPKNPKWIKILQEIMWEEHLDFDLNALAIQLGIHPVYLSTMFPKYFGMTYAEYVRKVKVKKSLGFLQIKQLSMTEIAYECGFADQSHFIRCFKKQMRCTPSQFRKKITQS